MKKLIAILVVFALVAGAAFAETSFGGSAEVRWMLAEDSGASGADTVTRAGIEAVGFQMSVANDEGTFGGMGKFVFMNMQVGPQGHERQPTDYKWDRVFAWWQPIPQVKFFLGLDGDGQFNTANLSRWGHHRMDRGISVEDWDAGNYLLGNWDSFGTALIITPMDGLAINFAMNLPFAGTRKYDDMFEDSIQVQIAYAIPDIGNVYATYNNFGGGDGNFGLTFFNSSFVDGLAFEVGGSVDLDADRSALRIGLGVHYSIEDFGVRFRAMIRPMEPTVGDDWVHIKADIMPFYNLSFGTIFCNFRIETRADEEINWHVNPYLKLNVGVGDFRVGALIRGNTVSGSDVYFRLATSMLVSF